MNLEELRRLERLAVLETLRHVGPEAPTLCAQWSSADLAAHLVASERYGGLPMVGAYKLRSVLPAGSRSAGHASAAEGW